MFNVSPARIRLLLCSLLVLLGAAALSVGGAVSVGAAAPAPLRAGTGYRLPGGDFVGFYLTRSGAKVYCIDPGKRAPSSVSLTSIGRYPGMSQRTADELAYALSRWGNATSRTQAAAESQLVNTIVGHADAVRRRAHSLPGSVGSLVAAHLRIVRALHGPYTVSVRATRAAAPGQTTDGSTGVVSAAGHGVPGVAIALRGSGNVSLPAEVRTGSRGSVTFRYTVTGTGPVRIDATASGLTAPRFTGTHPAAGQQRMVTWSRPVGASAHTGFQARLGSFAHGYACTTTCTGHPRTTLRACAVPSAYPARLAFRAGSTTLPMDFPAATRTGCRTIAAVLTDGDQVTASWTFHGPHGWTAPMAAGGAFVVDCPPVPVVRVSLAYDCTQGSLTASVTAPAAHPAVLLVAGAATRRIDAGSGATAQFTVPVRCGTVQAYSVQAGVRRADGAWNYGPAARVSTPGAARQP
jgi:hypothetical protein